MISLYLVIFVRVCCHPISPQAEVRRADSKQTHFSAQQVLMSLSALWVVHMVPGVALVLLNPLHEEGFAFCELK